MFLDKSKFESELGKKSDLEDISDERIQEIVRYIWEKRGCGEISNKDLLFEIIKLIKCDLKEAENMVEKMKQLGLTVCRPLFGNAFVDYNLETFGVMRGYILDSEIVEKRKKQGEEDKRFKIKEREREKKFVEKYGPEDEWSEETWDQYFGDDEDE